MNNFTRAFFQLLFWLLIWLVFGLFQNDFERFFHDNWIVYFFQAVSLISLIYSLAPKLLFKSRYLEFAVLSIGGLVLISFISSQAISIPDNPSFLPPEHVRHSDIPSPFFLDFLILAVTYVSAIFLETFTFAQNKEAALILSKSENIETELKFLKSQINPHFLFNALNNIYALSAFDPKKTQESILYLSDMLRYVLYECEKSRVSIEKEVAYIEDFIKLFVLKSSKTYPIKTQFLIENQKLLIAPMLLIPFVENAFKHSNIYDVAHSFINIDLHTKDEIIIIIIENSINQEIVNKDAVGGIGIRNVQKRLSLLYPDKHKLTICESENSFKVELKIDTHV
jgi:hypothetical protein